MTANVPEITLHNKADEVNTKAKMQNSIFNFTSIKELKMPVKTAKFKNHTAENLLQKRKIARFGSHQKLNKIHTAVIIWLFSFQHDSQ